jgi:hypothetical protein
MRAFARIGLLSLGAAIGSASPALAQSACSPDTLYADGFVFEVKTWYRDAAQDQRSREGLVHQGLPGAVPEDSIALIRDPVICARALAAYNSRIDPAATPWVRPSQSVYVIRVGGERWVVLHGDPFVDRRDYSVYDLEFRFLGGLVG